MERCPGAGSSAILEVRGAPDLRNGKASATAELIALSTVLLSHHPRDGRLVPAGAPELAARFLAASAPGKLRLFQRLSSSPLRHLLFGLEGLLLPGIQRHYAARKRFIEAAARDFIAAGGTQVVVIGAGLDTLAWRLARSLPEVLCVELDHPATQAEKGKAIDATTPPNLRFAPADLGEVSLGEALERTGALDPGRPAFFILEGLTMYLSEEAVASALTACARYAAGTRVAWTFLQPDPQGRLRFRSAGGGLIDAWLARKGEPFTWGIRPEEVPGFVAPLQLRVLEIAGPAALKARFLLPLAIDAQLPEGECICLCERLS